MRSRFRTVNAKRPERKTAGDTPTVSFVTDRLGDYGRGRSTGAELRELRWANFFATQPTNTAFRMLLIMIFYPSVQ